MIKAILAVDDKGGVSKKRSMPWPHNQKDLNWFKKNTINQVVIMGRTTWDDLKEKKPLSSRINVLVTSQESKKFPGADIYIKGDLEECIKNIKESIQFANAVGGLSATKIGTAKSMPVREEIDNLL